MTSQLPPREIQARIRSGESVEDVALAAQTTVEKVMVYAGPVLAERAHIAGLAQAASVRNAGGGVLEELVAGRLRASDTAPGDVEWDAWKQPDGRWAVAAEMPLDGVAQRASFTYDVPGRFSVAEDDLARWLVGEIATRPGSRRTPESVEDPAEQTGGAVVDGSEIPLPPAPAEQRLRAVRDGSLAPGDAAADADPAEPADPAVVSGVDAPAEVPASSGHDDQLSLGDDAIALVTGNASPRPADAPAADDDRWDQQPDVPSWLAEPSPTSTDDRSTPPPSPAPDPVDDPADSPADSPVGDQADQTTGQTTGPPAGAQDVLFGEPPTPDTDDDRARSSRKRGRASIPSWDEIMFGGPADGAPLADGDGPPDPSDDSGPSQV